MKKRGLSNIIVTLIMIVLVLVAVSLVWGIVNNIIQEGSEQIELGKFTLDLEIKSVTVEGDNVTVDVIVQRNPGPGEFVGMNFVFSDGQNSEIIRRDVVLKEFEEKSFTFTLAQIITSELEDVSVAPIYELKSGKENTGNVADKFEIANVSKITGGVVAGGVVNNFEALGYKGAGMVEYGPFSSDETKLPEFKRAIVNPLDVLPGDNQTFTVHVYSPHSVISVTSTTQLDNSTSDLVFLKISEYEGNGGLIEIWSISWIANDVHTETYRTNIAATDSEGNSNSIGLTWTDSCQSLFAHGTSGTIDTNCSSGLNSVYGLDGGNLTIATGKTLTIDSGAIWGFNDGTTITVDGTITVNGQISKTNLYYPDADGDGYGLGIDLQTSATNAIRAKDAIGVSDCNDVTAGGGANVYQQLTNLGLDLDQDGYSSGGIGSACVGAKSGDYYRATSGSYTWIPSVDATGTTDCNTGDGDIYQNVANLVLDADKNRYYIGSAATRCVGDKTSYWYKDADGTDKWISNAGSSTWGSGVFIGTGCVGFGGQLSGACSPEGATNNYLSGLFGMDCFNNPAEPEPEYNRYTQTCSASTSDTLGTDCASESCTWGGASADGTSCGCSSGSGSQLSGSCTKGATNDWSTCGDSCGKGPVYTNSWTQTCG